MVELISKDAALGCFHDWIDRYGNEHTADEDAAYQKIADLPAVQPDHTADISKKVSISCGQENDLISRKAAIEAIEKIAVNERDTDRGFLIFCGLSAAITVIDDLPSAQPKTAKRIVGKSRDGMTLWYQCDMCNEPVHEKDEFCSGCGRRLTDG